MGLLVKSYASNVDKRRFNKQLAESTVLKHNHVQMKTGVQSVFPLDRSNDVVNSAKVIKKEGGSPKNSQILAKA